MYKAMKIRKNFVNKSDMSRYVRGFVIRIERIKNGELYWGSTTIEGKNRAGTVILSFPAFFLL
jgi:hypothetical protein